MDEFDAIIIGTGQAGKPLALALARAGWSVAVIEREHVGGTCINVGCTPTKTMVASARTAYVSRRGAAYGVHAGPVEVNMAEVQARKQKMVERFRHYGQGVMEKTPKLELIFGEASFKDRRTVTVHLKTGGMRELSSGKIVINTGGRPSVPPLPGIEAIPYLDLTGIMELKTVPEHLIVLGGGYIGLEFAQMFRRFGARVTIVNRDARLIEREDADVSAEVEKILREDGIEVLNSVNVTRLEAVANGGVKVVLEGGAPAVSGSHLLLALGCRAVRG